ncbi:MAG: twin-arginine translocase TatA/TatE family subunit [Proteobacteria bacterium]|nr:twin-arginine translocase TatA/TatE family subunit [Pseudomonadota bacterium]
MSMILAFGFGTQEILIILAIILVLFGATKLPQLGSAVGQGIRNFKRGMREVKAEEEEAKRQEAQRQTEDKSDHPDNSIQS